MRATRVARAFAILLAVASVAATSVVAPPRRGAQSAAVSPVADLVLVSQTPWVSAGGELELRLRPPSLSASELSELELSVAVHPAVGTRSAFLRTLTDRPTSSPLAVIASSMASLAADEDGAVEIRVGIQDPAAPGDAAARCACATAGCIPSSPNSGRPAAAPSAGGW